MSNFIHRISKKIGFTEIEVKVLFFLISMFIIGYSYKLFFTGKADELSKFDYSYRDSLFLTSIEGENLKSFDKINDSNIDYKSEVLDFNKADFNSPKKKELPSKKSVNLNTAISEELMQLPGIGEKTASLILEHRKKIGKFKFVEQLLDIKGIGNSKLNKIKEYIFIE